MIEFPTSGVQDAGHQLHSSTFYDTVRIEVGGELNSIKQRAAQKEINLRYFEDGQVGVSVDETVEEEDLNDLLWVFGCKKSAVSAQRQIHVHSSDFLYCTSRYIWYLMPWVLGLIYSVSSFLFQGELAETVAQDTTTDLSSSAFNRTSTYLSHSVFHRSVKQWELTFFLSIALFTIVFFAS